MKWASTILSSVLFWFFVALVSYIALLGYDLLCLQYARQNWWVEFYNIMSAFLIGGLISFLFYFLVIYIPESRKRRMIKANLREWYSVVKRDILYQVIFASQKGGRRDLVADTDTVDRLLTIDGFKIAFEGGREGHEGVYAFRNYMSDDTPEYREILLNL